MLGCFAAAVGIPVPYSAKMLKFPQRNENIFASASSDGGEGPSEFTECRPTSRYVGCSVLLFQRGRGLQFN